MPINFVPNDPLAPTPAMRRVRPLPDRPTGTAGFVVQGTAPSGLHPPGTPAFVQWQARQAALLAMVTWQKVLGTTLPRWTTPGPNPTKLQLIPDGGEDLNAYYNRTSLGFYHYPTSAGVLYSGASTDVVAHEVGHGILDAVRPDLWSSFYLETGGFHESYGDVTAILVALADIKTRQALLAVSPRLDTANMVESTAEDLSNGVRLVLGPTHPASKPRRALNSFVWQLPETMPVSGGPDVMIAEVHSIARIMTGCFWDVLRGIFNAKSRRGQSALWTAAVTTAKLFHQATLNAPITERFYQAIGRAMVIADDANNGGVHRSIVGQAFAGHGIALGSSAMLAPAFALNGAAVADDSGQLGAAVMKDLTQRLALSNGAEYSVRRSGLEAGVANVGFRVPVALDGIDARLAGVSAMADVEVLVGASGGRAAVLGAAPQSSTSAEAVRHFVSSLVANDQIAFTPAKASAVPASGSRRSTHEVVDVNGVRSLQRTSFTCGPHCGDDHLHH
jgi:hypothetical protein